MVDALQGLTDVNNTLSQTQLNTNPSQAEVAGSRLADDFDEFLLLLTTQLQNQDPTEPLDVNQLTNQLVLFSGVEQQIASNSLLEQIAANSATDGFSEAVSFIGNFVDAPGRAGELRAGDGNASFAYELPTPAEEVEVIITNAAGGAVFGGLGPGNTGRNLVAWDGINSFTGQQEPPGTYFISVTARDAQANEIDVQTLTTGEVRGTGLNDSNEVILIVAGTEIALDDVLAVRQAAPVVQ